MSWIALDGNVLADLCRGPQAVESLGEWLLGRKHQGSSIVVVPQIIAESEQIPDEKTADRLLSAIGKWCDGIVARDASKVLHTDLTVPNPYAAAIKAGLWPVSRISKARKSRGKARALNFLKTQRIGYDKLRQVMPELEQHFRKAGQYSMIPFREYVEGRWLDLFGRLIRYCVNTEKFHVDLPKDEVAWERLWKRGRAFRLVILIWLANEYRCGGKAKGRKAEGCMTDVRVLMESAYVDEIVTKDNELFECGDLLIQEGLLDSPSFVKWPLSAQG